MPSKNKKKAWKNIPTEKVEDYFSSVNYDIRFGGSITSRPDEQLFKLSKAPEVTTQSLPRIIKMKSWSHLYPDPSIAPVKQPSRSNTINKISSPISASLRRKVLSIRRLREQRVRKRTQTDEWEMFTDPLWGEDCVNPDSELVNKTTRQTLKVPDSVLLGRSDKRNPSLPAVLLPHPGASYRPRENEHTRLLESVKIGEERRLRAERRLKRSLSGMRRLSKRDIAREERRQMREGLFEESKPETESDADTAQPAAPVCKQRKRKRKRKGLALERRKVLLEVKKRKLVARQAEDIQNIKSLTRRLDKHTPLRRKRPTTPLTRRLGRLRYHEPMRDFQLTSEIAPCLGRLVPEGDLLRDRYKSLQKRNVIEVRKKRILKRKYKLKAYQKNSHKEDA